MLIPKDKGCERVEHSFFVHGDVEVEKGRHNWINYITECRQIFLMYMVCTFRNIMKSISMINIY